MLRSLPLLLLALAGCAGPRGGGDRELETAHQPLVGPGGAYVPGCPDWSETGPMRESQSSNYGCATAVNLAAMIADPVDLLHGRGDGLSDAATSARAITAWGDAPATERYWKPERPITDKLDPAIPVDPHTATPRNAVAAPSAGGGGQ